MPKTNLAEAPLSELISAVLKHPDCPTPLYNAMVDELSDCVNTSSRYRDYIDSPADVERQLSHYEGETIGGACYA